MQDPAPPTLSPDGFIRVEWSVNTGRMSHEILSPTVLVHSTGEMLVDLQDCDTDARFRCNEDSTFLMHLRRYSGGDLLSVQVDYRNRTLRFGDGPPQPLTAAQKLTVKTLRGH